MSNIYTKSKPRMISKQKFMKTSVSHDNCGSERPANKNTLLKSSKQTAHSTIKLYTFSHQYATTLLAPYQNHSFEVMT